MLPMVKRRREAELTAKFALLVKENSEKHKARVRKEIYEDLFWPDEPEEKNQSRIQAQDDLNGEEEEGEEEGLSPDDLYGDDERAAFVKQVFDVAEVHALLAKGSMLSPGFLEEMEQLRERVNGITSDDDPSRKKFKFDETIWREVLDVRLKNDPELLELVDYCDEGDSDDAETVIGDPNLTLATIGEPVANSSLTTIDERTSELTKIDSGQYMNRFAKPTPSPPQRQRSALRLNTKIINPKYIFHSGSSDEDSDDSQKTEKAPTHGNSAHAVAMSSLSVQRTRPRRDTLVTPHPPPLESRYTDLGLETAHSSSQGLRPTGYRRRPSALDLVTPNPPSLGFSQTDLGPETLHSSLRGLHTTGYGRRPSVLDSALVGSRPPLPESRYTDIGPQTIHESLRGLPTGLRRRPSVPDPALAELNFGFHTPPTSTSFAEPVRAASVSPSAHIAGPPHPSLRHYPFTELGPVSERGVTATSRTGRRRPPRLGGIRPVRDPETKRERGSSLLTLGSSSGDYMTAKRPPIRQNSLRNPNSVKPRNFTRRRSSTLGEHSIYRGSFTESQRSVSCVRYERSGSFAESQRSGSSFSETPPVTPDTMKFGNNFSDPKFWTSIGMDKQPVPITEEVFPEFDISRQPQNCVDAYTHIRARLFKLWDDKKLFTIEALKGRKRLSENPLIKHFKRPPSLTSDKDDKDAEIEDSDTEDWEDDDLATLNAAFASMTSIHSLLEESEKEVDTENSECVRAYLIARLVNQEAAECLSDNVLPSIRKYRLKAGERLSLAMSTQAKRKETDALYSDKDACHDPNKAVGYMEFLERGFMDGEVKESLEKEANESASFKDANLMVEPFGYLIAWAGLFLKLAGDKWAAEQEEARKRMEEKKKEEKRLKRRGIYSEARVDLGLMGSGDEKEEFDEKEAKALGLKTPKNKKKKKGSKGDAKTPSSGLRSMRSFHSLRSMRSLQSLGRGLGADLL